VSVQPIEQNPPAASGLTAEPLAGGGPAAVTRPSAVKLETRNLNLYYGDFLAVRNIGFCAAEREITAIIGPSGCGKSTLIRSLNRINDLIPGFRAEGEILLDGTTDINRPGTDVISTRRRIGMLFQRPNPFPSSIYENVAYGVRLEGRRRKAELDECVERSLRRTALWDEVQDRLHKSALGLSGGQQQRLCLARTLAVDSEVILMDEPASALDPIATLKIEELLRELRDSVTIVIVTHNMQQATRVSDYTAFMLMGEGRAGELVEYAPTQDFFNRPKDRRTEDYITGRFG
jgi:phosphate transport system ATP-binding protein